MRSRDPDEARQRLRRFGIADLHGLLALVAGTVAVVTSVACCFAPNRPGSDLAMVALGAWVVALWTGLFGILTRGTRWAGTAARLGLLLSLVALGFSFLAWFRFA